MQNLLQTLGISYGLSKEEIKKAYRKKSMEVHPDRQNGDEYKMMLLNTAYEYIIENYDDYLNKKEIIKENPLALFNEGLYMYYVLKDYELGIQRFEKTIQLNPGYQNAYYIQGLCFYKLGNTQQALQNLIKFQKSNPKHRGVYGIIIKILKEQGDEEQVKKYKTLLEKNTPEKKKNHAGLIKELNEKYTEEEKTKNYKKYNLSSYSWLFQFIITILLITILLFLYPEIYEKIENFGKSLRK